MTTKFYRITGAQSIDRLEPLLTTVDAEVNWIGVGSEVPSSPLDIVWETTCEKAWIGVHNSALVLNRLHNSQIFEDKSNFAFLQLRMECSKLISFVALGTESLKGWCERKWKGALGTDRSHLDDIDVDINIETLMPISFLGEAHSWSLPPSPTEGIDSDWWALKASKGNGGKDVWVMNRDNYERVLLELPSNEEFVVQKYIGRPLLWNGKKFHFRCYAMVRADMRAYVYEQCFILCAGLDYENSDSSAPDMKHLTNLSINKALPGHPGQVPCWLSRECPEIYSKVCHIWSEVVNASSPFMSEQRSPLHFEFVGLDIICDAYGECYLLEVNRLPGLESSKNRCKPQEDNLYNEMMAELLRLVLSRPEHHVPACPSSFLEPTAGNMEARGSDANAASGPGMVLDSSVTKATETGTGGLWREVREGNPSTECCLTSTLLFKNLFSWKAFTKKNRNSLILGNGSTCDGGAPANVETPPLL